MTNEEKSEEWWRRRMSWEFAPVEATQQSDGSWVVRKAGFVGVGRTRFAALHDVRQKLALHHALPGEEWIERGVGARPDDSAGG